MGLPNAGHIIICNNNNVLSYPIHISHDSCDLNQIRCRVCCHTWSTSLLGDCCCGSEPLGDVKCTGLIELIYHPELTACRSANMVHLFAVGGDVLQGA